MIRAIVLAAAVLAPGLAAAQQGQPPALHPKAWYVGHVAARHATLIWCHSDATHADLYDCQNAEAADALTIGQQSVRHGTVDAYLRDPAYWAQNPIYRGSALHQCRYGGVGTETMQQYCGAVRAGDTMARAGR